MSRIPLYYRGFLHAGLPKMFGQQDVMLIGIMLLPAQSGQCSGFGIGAVGGSTFEATTCGGAIEAATLRTSAAIVSPPNF
jgi:hypothetical protein